MGCAGRDVLAVCVAQNDRRVREGAAAFKLPVGVAWREADDVPDVGCAREGWCTRHEPVRVRVDRRGGDAPESDGGEEDVEGSGEAHSENSGRKGEKKYEY